MKYDSRLHKRRRRLLHAFGEGVGVPVSALTINGNPVVINGYYIVIGG